ncbi:hypothetical protein [Dokdonella sp.]|uniref:hypothetical protein n=1 Tax=Dokdonella sp. TaxID=2291710 RepID=UPI0025B879AE|nr:hypothetical protein [Dokdonella sp.]MBX3692601.1 hypothetical protein [Dokdonella sp.]
MGWKNAHEMLTPASHPDNRACMSDSGNALIDFALDAVTNPQRGCNRCHETDAVRERLQPQSNAPTATP